MADCEQWRFHLSDEQKTAVAKRSRGMIAARGILRWVIVLIFVGVGLRSTGAQTHPPVQVNAPRVAWLFSESESALSTVQMVETDDAVSASDRIGSVQPAMGSGLTLDELQARALASNPSIQQAEAIVRAARGRAFQVGMKANPEVGIDFQQLASDGQAEQYGLFFEQEIIRREKLSLNRSVASHETQRLQQVLAAQRQRVRTDVELAFIRVLRAQRQIDMTAQLVKLSEQALRVAEQLLKAKEVGRGDVLQAELEVESSEILLLNANNRHTAAWRALSAVSGQSTLAEQPIDGDLFAENEPILFDQALQRLQQQSPEISAAFSAIERARCNVQRQQVEPLPNVTVGGLLNWRDNGAGGDANGGLVVSLPLPLKDRNQGAIVEAQQQLVAAQRELEKLNWQLQERLAPVYERYQNARQQADRYMNSILPKAEETLTLTRETYELGEASFISLLTAQRTYAQTMLDFIESLESLRLAEAEMKGMLLSGSLN